MISRIRRIVATTFVLIAAVGVSSYFLSGALPHKGASGSELFVLAFIFGGLAVIAAAGTIVGLMLFDTDFGQSKFIRNLFEAFGIGCVTSVFLGGIVCFLIVGVNNGGNSSVIISTYVTEMVAYIVGFLCMFLVNSNDSWVTENQSPATIHKLPKRAS